MARRHVKTSHGEKETSLKKGSKRRGNSLDLDKWLDDHKNELANSDSSDDRFIKIEDVATHRNHDGLSPKSLAALQVMWTQ